MKKRIKMLMIGGMVAAGLFASSNVKAISDNEYNFNIYKKYIILTDEGKIKIPDSYHFNDGSDDGYNLSLTTFKSMLENVSNTYSDYVNYNSSTGEFSSKYGIMINYEGNVDKVLLNTNGLISEDLNSTKNTLIRIAKYSLLKNLRNKSLVELNRRLDEAETDYARRVYSTQIQNYNEDLAEWQNVSLDDLPNNKKGYNFVTAETSRAILKEVKRMDDGTHIGDIININHYYYTIIIRDLRLNEIKYKVNGGEEKAVLNFNKDTKTYSVQLPLDTPKNATITTTSKSYALVEDVRRNWKYDSGITVQDANITLTNGTGTAKIKVKFDATPYGDNGIYEKEYTINFSALEYQKGDVNKDTYINATDAAMILDLFKNQNAVQDNYDYGDMNNDNLLNSTDAAMVLDIFKNS